MRNSKDVKLKSKSSHVPHSPGVEKMKDAVVLMKIELRKAIEANNETMTKDLSRGIRNIEASITRLSQ